MANAINKNMQDDMIIGWTMMMSGWNSEMKQ